VVRALIFSQEKAPRGWLLAHPGGGETQEYLDDATNTPIYDVNRSAHYEPEILRFLTSLLVLRWTAVRTATWCSSALTLPSPRWR